ncbi:MAG TPA: hypothetical protein DCR23_05545 [Ruminococcaceae bacterium]|nr:hypothetical protein [Oscillospiraceae bacterium]
MEILNSIINYFLWFVFYSVSGWIIETLLFAVRDKKSVKRGFLFGPLCPIYGTGAVVCTLIMYGRITNFFVLFIAGLVLCDTIEYVTHYVMEKAFHAKWWDYSNQRFNIKGRICLASSLLFGGGVAVLIKFIQPAVMSVTDRIPFTAKAIAAFIIYSVLIVDVAFTIQSLKDIIKSLKEIQNYAVENAQQKIDRTDEKLDEFVEKVKSIPSPEQQWEKLKTNEHIEELLNKMTGEKAQFYKLKNIFPKMQFWNYKEAFEIITARFKKK